MHPKDANEVFVGKLAVVHSDKRYFLQIPLSPCDPFTAALDFCVCDGTESGIRLVMTEERRLIFEL